MKKALFAAAILMLALSLPMSAAVERVRVTVHNANVRSEPSLSGEIVLKAAKGDEFGLLERVEGWYKIHLPRETGSKVREGYISESVAELSAAPDTETPLRAEKPAARPAPRPAAAPPVDGNLMAGLAAKFGYMTAPAASFGDRWLLAFTLEKGFNPFLAAGIEFQPYFRSYSDADISATTLGANVFLNAKGGVNLGRFTPTLKFLTPYAGVGLGGALAASSYKLAGESSSQTAFRFAWHLLFGLEVKVKSLVLIAELQALKIPVKEVDPDRTQYFMMLGARF